MMSKNNISIKKLDNILNKYSFISKYQRFISREDVSLEYEDLIKILSIAVLLLNNRNSDEILIKMGYKLILKYSLLTNDFGPLYDISKELYNIPVLNFILSKKNIIKIKSILIWIFPSIYKTILKMKSLLKRLLTL